MSNISKWQSTLEKPFRFKVYDRIQDQLVQDFRIIKRITRSAIIGEINTKDVSKSFTRFYIFGINFHNDCASGYSLYNQIICPK